jgi:hypothetical protein
MMRSQSRFTIPSGIDDIKSAPEYAIVINHCMAWNSFPSGLIDLLCSLPYVPTRFNSHVALSNLFPDASTNFLLPL